MNIEQNVQRELALAAMLEKEINYILEKFIIHLYDNFDFKEAELKIKNELNDYYTEEEEEELYDMYWFGYKYVRDKFLTNFSDNNILEKIFKEKLGDNYHEVFNVLMEQLLLYDRKYYGDDASNKLLINDVFGDVKNMGGIIMEYLSYYYCEHEDNVKLIVYNTINNKIIK
jgi:hypothetical protein